MKLGEVLKKERERKKLTLEDISPLMGLATTAYQELESGESPIEEWGPRLAQIAIKLKTPTSRLISETGKSAQAGLQPGQCGDLIRKHREKRGISAQELSRSLDISEEEMRRIESGESPLETCAPLLLRFAEVIEQPVFNLFYPCGLPFSELKDYP